MKAEEKKAVGERIAELRDSSGLTQPQLAELVGCHVQRIKDWTIGVDLPSCEYLLPLASALSTSAEYILSGAGGEADGAIAALAPVERTKIANRVRRLAKKAGPVESEADAIRVILAVYSEILPGSTAASRLLVDKWRDAFLRRSLGKGHAG